MAVNAPVVGDVDDAVDDTNILSVFNFPVAGLYVRPNPTPAPASLELSPRSSCALIVPISLTNVRKKDESILVAVTITLVDVKAASIIP